MDHAELISKMTDEEKASLCSGADFWHTKGVSRLGIPQMMLTDGPHGLRKQIGKNDHLGLNAAYPATCFPTASAAANSWDEAMIEQMGRRLGAETRTQRVGVILGPGVNIKRSPLCGRNFEYYSAAGRKMCRSAHTRRAVKRHRRLCQALCRKLAGDAAHDQRLGHGRAHPA